VAGPGARRGIGPSPGTTTETTRQALVDAAVEALREVGYAGATAREIARRAGCTQGLVFYHFGSVVNLLLAALDSVSETRLARYSGTVAGAAGVAGLVDAAASIFEEDLDRGHLAVLAEMLAGTSSTPGLGPEVAARLAPWRRFAADAIGDVLAGTPLAQVVSPEQVAHGVVALYLGLELLAHLDGDRAPALALFARAKALASLLDGLGVVTGAAP